jgi:DNA-binding beta-propeller fold protein YncE
MPIASIRKPVVFHLGPVPVAAVVTMTFMASFDVSSDSAFTGNLGIDISGPMQCGIRLDGGAWSLSSEASPAYTPRPFQYESRAGARMTFTIEPRIEIEFYGAPSVELEFGPSFGLEERDEGFPVLAWEVFASYHGAAAFDRGAFDRYTAPFESGRSRCCAVTLASGPFHTGDYIFVGQWGIGGPPGSAFSYPTGIAVDAGGNVYVVESWNGEVQKFGAEGVLLRRWGEPGAGDGQFDTPGKIAVDEDGFVYVADGGNNRVQKFSSEGTFILKWGSEGAGDGQFRSPVGVAAAGGVVYVTDGRNNRVQKFSSSGAFLGAWGEYGAGPGQFNGPMGIAIDPADGTVLVADCQNHRIQRFSMDGAPLGSWGSHGAGDGRFNCAVDVTAAAGGAVFVADIGNDRFERFAADGTFITKLGTTGTAEGQFDHPEGVALDARGYVYVLDARNSRVQWFAPRIR